MKIHSSANSTNGKSNGSPYSGYDNGHETQARLENSPDIWLAMFESSQLTMRHFLSVQQQVVGQFLGSLAGTTLPETPTLPVSFSSPIGRVLATPTEPNTSMMSVAQPVPTQVLTPIIQPQAVSTPLNPLPLEIIAHPAPAQSLPLHPLPVQPPTPQLGQADSESPALDRDRLTTLLLDLASDRTGYPPEMLGLDQDLEAELGIDSIKRVEILGALQKALPLAWVEPMQQQMESLTQVKNLNSLIDRVLTLAEHLPSSI